MKLGGKEMMFPLCLGLKKQEDKQSKCEEEEEDKELRSYQSSYFNSWTNNRNVA